MSVFKTQLIGNCGNDATIQIVNGRNCINFSVAHSEKWKDAQGVQKEKTTWVSCSLWSEKTGIAPYLKKGTLVYVDGSIEAKVWTNNQGQSIAQLQLKVWDVKLLGGQKQDNGQSVNNNASSNVASDIEPPDAKDLPF